MASAAAALSAAAVALPGQLLALLRAHPLPAAVLAAWAGGLYAIAMASSTALWPKLYVIGSVLAAMLLNMRNKRPGEWSAFSVFNPGQRYAVANKLGLPCAVQQPRHNCVCAFSARFARRLLGTLDPEQIDREIRHQLPGAGVDGGDYVNIDDVLGDADRDSADEDGDEDARAGRIQNGGRTRRRQRRNRQRS